MNRENLQRMADYIRTVPKEKFSMIFYRTKGQDSRECNSIGCVIGHCTVLDPRPLPIDPFGNIEFDEWSFDFTGVDSSEWGWCFHSDWSTRDNTPTGAADRIEWLLNHGLPKNWEEQMRGYEPLCYKGGES
jgi:hypothetical protein